MTLLKRAMNTGRIKTLVGGPAGRALPLIAIALALAVLAALGPDAQRPAAQAASLADVSISPSSTEPGVVTRSQKIDYDADNDGLIEISNLEQLNAIRWDLIGNGQTDHNGYAAAFPNAADDSCPDHSRPGSFSGCLGYELTKDLDFDDAGSYASGVVNTAWTSGAGWQPIGSWHSRWGGTFQGNGHTISNLLINRTGNRATGLFASMGRFSSVKRLGLVDAEVSGGSGGTGALVGDNIDGTIASSYGSVTVSGSDAVGGLAGYSTGTIESSYATGTVNGSSYNVGGLVGRSSGGAILESYAAVAVSASSVNYGGLLGRNDAQGKVRNSYSTGTVSGSGDNGGGLVGRNIAGSVVSNSYYDGQATGRSEGTGAKTTVEMKWPTSASGIYIHWPVSLWHFGTATDYPLLKVDFNGDGTASWQEFGQQTRTSPPAVDYDADDDNLIEISKLEQLNAIRWDLDGNGISKNSDHSAVFPNPAANYGCFDRCLGYELAADLDFDDTASYASGVVNTAWTSGAGWQPIGHVNITVALVAKVSEVVSGNDTAWRGPGVAVSIPTSGWSEWDCPGAATAAGIATF